MKIGIDARMYGPSVTGIGNYVKNLTENLLRLDHDNDYYFFIYGKNANLLKNIPKTAHLIICDIPWYTYKEQTQYAKILSRYKLDVMHFTNFNIPIFYPRKILVTIHDLTPRFFPGKKVQKSFFRKTAYELVLRAALRRSKYIITVSEFTKAEIIRYYCVPNDKIKVIYLGFSKYFQKIENYGTIHQLKKEFNILYPYIFYTGVWRPHKNIYGLIDTFEVLLRKNNSQLNLVIGGEDKDYQSQIFEYIRNKNLEKFVIFPGFLNERKLASFYQGARVTVIPSFREGFGLIGVEALACGCPVAASDTTSVPEILQNAALYFNPKDINNMSDTVQTLLSDEGMRNKILSNSVPVLKNYRWDSCAKRTIELYRKAMQA